MKRWALLALLAPSIVLAYNPSPPELLGRMGSAWGKAKPVKVRLLVKEGEDRSAGEREAAVPGAEAPGRKVPEGFVPFARILAGGDLLTSAVPSLLASDATTGVARLDTTVCYRLEGRTERMWLRKSDLVPLKVERLVADGVWAVTTYRNMAVLEERIPYPERTEFSVSGKPVFVEHLVKDAPPPSPP